MYLDQFRKDYRSILTLFVSLLCIFKNSIPKRLVLCPKRQQRPFVQLRHWHPNFLFLTPSRQVIYSNLLQIIILFNIIYSLMSNRIDKLPHYLAGDDQQTTTLIDSLLFQLKSKKYNYQRIIAEAAQTYDIKKYKVQKITLENVVYISHSIHQKYYSSHRNHIADSEWMNNELRLFLWIIILYLYIKGKTIQQLDCADWRLFSSVFRGKSQQVFQYQAKIIFKAQRVRIWANQEDQLLTSIIQKMKEELNSEFSFRWSEIAKKMYVSSEGQYLRNPKQCRERWMNHLDPQKIKSNWDGQEDYMLIKLVHGEGKKWALVSKLMGSKRTEHTVKNRYNSLIRNQKKKGLESNEENIRSIILNRLQYLNDDSGWQGQDKKEKEQKQGTILYRRHHCLKHSEDEKLSNSLIQVKESPKMEREEKSLSLGYIEIEQYNWEQKIELLSFDLYQHYHLQ